MSVPPPSPAERIESWELLDLLASLVQKSLVLYEEQDGKGRHRLLETVQSYYKLRLAEQRDEERLVRSGRYGEVDEMEQTWLGRIKAKARREARREARLETLQEAVQRAIRVRFPEASPALGEQVAQVRDATSLESLLDRVIVAGSVEEVERLLQAGS